MTELVYQQVANGILVGSCYALASVGLTMIFGVLRAINFAHGEYFMFGAFASFTCMEYLGICLPCFNPYHFGGIHYPWSRRIAAGNGNRVELAGRYAAGCGQFSVSRAVMKAPDYAYGLFRTFWQQSGGTIGGGMRLGTLPADAQLLYSHKSLTLAAVIRLVNKYSSNSMAARCS